MNNKEINLQSPFRDLGFQLSIFEKLPPYILQKEWEKEYIKNPPPIVTDEQRKLAQEKIKLMNELSKPSKLLNFQN